MVVPLSAIPPSRYGFYAINNQFLANGPKGFQELKTLENGDMFIRLDLPGVPEDAMKVVVDSTKKAVTVFALAPKEHRHDSSPRNYLYTTGLVCKCCEVTAVAAHMSDGVLRLLLSKTQISTQRPPFIGGVPDSGQDHCWTGSHKFPNGTDPHDPVLTGRVLQPHPWVKQGSLMAYESKQLVNGCLYVRVDMPGVPKEMFTVSVKSGIVMVTGDAPSVSYDSGGRFYSGEVALLSTPIDIPIRQIKIISKNGVIRLIIPPA
ncbi:HSP20-like chaperone [Raphanus sativus]|uniref:57 kDa heat shock protein n=1 Tax=Raphanus sativus TaxID=3726 RepID=A0A6J0LKM8_RAPSA|nr:putative 57 kDa heat shock protein [Raphanus sativus]XP_056857847.1 putative 57 kDa heat shock protein [Raphanus sativus]KAJ4866203.1 HSP20-like chaperone [Raphanus sativus]KAJ4867790.1 HSP20-like chaperone [Raphanus sativus]